MAGTAVFLVSAVAALSAGLVLLGQAGARTQEQRRLAEANYAEAQRQRDLARTNFQLARRSVDESFVQVSENTLLKSPLPGFQELRRELLESALKYYQEAGQLDRGRETFQKALGVAEPLARENPAVIDYREAVIAIHNDFGHLQLRAGRDAEAARSFETALELAKKLPRGTPNQFSLAYIYRGVAKLRRKEQQTAAALEALQEAVRIGETNPGEKPYSTYELACARALCSTVCVEGQSERTAVKLAASRRYADGAMDALRQAVADGWKNVTWMRADPDLDPLRSRDDFKAVMAELETALRAPD